MNYFPTALQELADQFARLPGIGGKTAQRLAFHVLSLPLEDAQSFEPILDILVRKAAEGVEVRLMYDDIGSVGYVNLRFARRMNQLGIRCQAFNPAMPFLNFFMNHKLVFNSRVSTGKAMLRYYMLAIPQMAAQVLLTQGVYWLFAIPDSATGLRTLLYAVVMTVLYIASFMIQQRWVFAAKTSTK